MRIKIQKTKTGQHLMTIPIEIVEELKLKKGQRLFVCSTANGFIATKEIK